MIISTCKPTAQRPFHVLLKPVGPLCNLNCDYCFYLDKANYFPGTNRFDMSDEVLEIHIRGYIESQPRGCREVTFGWQGGEPTLRGIEFYRKAVDLQKKFQRPGMAVVNTFQTNGVMIDEEWARFFKQHDFLVGISIDGDEELHDYYRKHSNGKGSYKQVIRGLRYLQRYGVEYNVLTAVQSDNGRYGKRVYQHLTALGIQFIQFIPVVEGLKGKGVSERSVSAQVFGQFMIDVFDIWRKQDIGKVFVSHFDNALGMSLGMPSSICVHSPKCGDNLVMEHNGDVYSCDHYVYPDHQLGNLKTNEYPNLIDTPIQQDFSQAKILASEIHCCRCSQRDLCHGACPAQRINDSGFLSLKAGHHLCEGYFMFFSYIRPYLKAMTECLRQKRPVTHYLNYMECNIDN